MNINIHKSSLLLILGLSISVFIGVAGNAEALQSNQVNNLKTKANAVCDKKAANAKDKCRKGVEQYITSKGDEAKARKACTTPGGSVPVTAAPVPGASAPTISIPSYTDPDCIEGVSIAVKELAKINANSNSPTAAAKSGFDLKKTQAETCKKFSGNNKKKCEDAFEAEVKKVGTNGAISNQTKKNTCSRFSGNEKKVCERAFSDYNKEVNNAKEEIEAANDPAMDCIENRNECNLMKKYVNPIITFLTAFVGIAVTIGIISGGIRIATSADDPSKLAAGKKQIGTAIFALLAMMILYALIRWLTPSA